MSQKKAVIVLILKGRDYSLLSSWRPISLICVDVKIISKIIALRIKPLLSKCISSEQFCGGSESIIQCNNIARDLIEIVNNSKETGALVNIDLQRAFDSVDHKFLFKILEKNGLP